MSKAALVYAGDGRIKSKRWRCLDCGKPGLRYWFTHELAYWTIHGIPHRYTDLLFLYECDCGAVWVDEDEGAALWTHAERGRQRANEGGPL